MERNEARLMLHASLDGELDAASELALSARIAADPALKAEAEALAALRRALRDGMPRDAPPASLRLGVLRRAGAAPSASVAGWRAVAAAALISLGLGAGGTWLALTPGADEPAFDQVVAGHLRALAATQATDISSSDRHTVKPWFAGRVAFAPRVFDLTEKGFPLVGGRVDIIDGRPAATLVYRRRQHLISLTANPESRQAADWSGTRRGYSLLRWSEDGVVYRAVSDLGPSEMGKFAETFRTTARAP